MIPLSLATSLSGSPSSLQFEIQKGEKECKMITITSEDYKGDINSKIRWAGKDVYIENPNDFNFTAEDLNLEVTYTPQEIKSFNGKKEIEICAKGEDIGVYRGSLEYRTVSDGNIGVGVGTWLLVNITEQTSGEESSAQTNTNSNSGSGGSGSSSAGSGGGSALAGTDTQAIDSDNESQNTNSETGESEIRENSEETEKGVGITGAVIGAGSKKTNGIVIAVVILVIGVGLTFYNKRAAKQKLMGYK